MEGSTVQAMAEAVEGAKVVLVCASPGYMASRNCYLEAEYAHVKKKPIIPIMMEDGFKAEGWLGILLGAKLWYKFWDPEEALLTEGPKIVQSVMHALEIETPEIR